MPSPDEHLNSTFWESYDLYVQGVFQRHTDTALVSSLKRDLWTSSVVTPGFRRLKRKRWLLPVNPYNKHQIVFSDPQCSWHAAFRENTGYYDDWYWQLNAYHYVGYPTYFVAADDPSQRAIAKLLAQLSETKVNTMVTGAEMHKTVEHVAKTATRIFNAYKALKRGDFTGFTTSLGLTTTTAQRKRFNKRLNKAKSFEAQQFKYSESSMTTMGTGSDLQKFASQTWLEYSYGWKPLLFDVYSHAQALAELSIARQNVVRHVSAKAKTEVFKAFDSVAAGDPHRIHTSLKDERWVKFGVAYSLQNGELNTFAQLGIDNPLEVAWEIVPFSFVADWFVPVGAFLKSLTATTGLVFHSGFKTSRWKITYDRTVTPCGTINRATGTTTITGNACVQHIDDWGITRVKLNSFPTPEFPGFRNPFGSGEDFGLKKALSSIALLHTLFLSKR